MSFRLRRKLVNFASRDGTREIRVKLHASFVWPASTGTSWDRSLREPVQIQETGAKTAVKGSTRAPKEPPPTRSATAARRASTRHWLPRLRPACASAASVVRSQRAGGSPNAQHAALARRPVQVRRSASRAYPVKSSWAAHVKCATRGGIPGSEPRRAPRASVVAFRTRKVRRRVRPVSQASTAM